MATRQGSGSIGNDRAFRYNWPGLLNGDNGNAIRMPRFADKTVQAIGTFGVGGTVKIMGSMDGTNWFQLKDHNGTAINLASATPGAVIAEVPDYLQPQVSAGDGTTSLTVYLTAEGGL